MKVMIKQLENGKFQMVDPRKLLGKSICDYCIDSVAAVVVAMYSGEEMKRPDIIFSNKEEYVDEYMSKGVNSFLAKDIKNFLSGEVVPDVICKMPEDMMNGAEFISVSSMPEQDSLF